MALASIRISISATKGAGFRFHCHLCPGTVNRKRGHWVSTHERAMHALQNHYRTYHLTFEDIKKAGNE